jgi:hypothetical protein
MPYRRRHLKSRGEKIILYSAVTGFSVVAAAVIAFLVFGGKIFGTHTPPVAAPAGPNTLAPGARPPPPVIRQAPPVRPAPVPPPPPARPPTQPAPGQVQVPAPQTPPRQ